MAALWKAIQTANRRHDLMSCYRQQAQIDVAPAAVWDLVGSVDRHPEWWPRVIDVHCDGLEQGCSYRQVYKSPMGVVETAVSIERLEGCRELLLCCLDTGTYTRWLLTEAQGGTFIDAEFGLDPKTARTRVFDVVAGRRYFRHWLEQSIDALRQAAREEEVTKDSECIFPTGRAADRQYRIKEDRWQTRL